MTRIEGAVNIAINRPHSLPEHSMRAPVKILGRTIGTYDDWDRDEEITVYYGFIPVDVLKNELPEGDINVEYEKGYLSFYKDDGQLYKRFDMLTYANMIQRDPDASAVQS